MSKITKFVEKYGYTYKAIILGILLFPPASILIAWKKPDLHITLRILFTIISVISPFVPWVLGALGISKFFS